MFDTSSAGRIGLAAALVAGLAACSEYMDRKDTIDFSAGDAVHTNLVTHMVDPWPVHARNKNIPMHGERAARATERYRCYANPLHPGLPGEIFDNDAGGGGGGPPSVNVTVNSGPPPGPKLGC
jgi:hypothetical protein